MGARDLKIHPKRPGRDWAAGLVRPLHQGNGRRVPDKLIKSDGVEIGLPVQPVKIKMINRDPAFVEVKKDVGGTFDTAGVPDAKALRQPLNEEGLPAPKRTREGHAGPVFEFFTQGPGPAKGLALGMGQKIGFLKFTGHSKNAGPSRSLSRVA